MIGTMLAPPIGNYQRCIVDELRCSLSKAAMIEDIIRNQVFHSTLDWQTLAQLRRGVRQAWIIFRANHEIFERDFRERRRIFQEAKKAEEVI